MQVDLDFFYVGSYAQVWMQIMYSIRAIFMYSRMQIGIHLHWSVGIFHQICFTFFYKTRIPLIRGNIYCFLVVHPFVIVKLVLGLACNNNFSKFFWENKYDISSYPKDGITILIFCLGTCIYLYTCSTTL